MANEGNLKPFKKGRSSEEAVRNGRKGGVKSGESRRLKSALNEILGSQVKGKDQNALLEEMGIPKSKRNHARLLMATIVQQAEKGYPSQQRMILDMQGETAEARYGKKELKLKEKALQMSKDEQGTEKKIAKLFEAIGGVLDEYP